MLQSEIVNLKRKERTSFNSDVLSSLNNKRCLLFQAINVYVLRKDYCGKSGFSLREGEVVQVITVLPDGCFWKVATINPPFKEGLVPSDLLCPELLHQSRPENPGASKTTRVEECTVRENMEPLKVLQKFTQPPSVRKPVPVPRSNAPKSPTGTS